MFSYNIDNIKNKIDDIVELGFNRNDVICTTVKLPSLFGLSIDNIKRKKEFYDMVGLTNVMILEPKYIMQSVELSYARYMFCRNIGLNIDMSNYRILFMGQVQFNKRFGINNEEVINIYNYNEYLENRDKDIKRLVLE